MITHKQLSLADIFNDCQNKFDNDKYQFLALLENTRRLRNAKSRINTAFFCCQNKISPQGLW